MTLAPLIASDFAIQLHVATAVAAVLIGGLVLWRRKGTHLHKMLGRVWVVLMLVTATSALFINEIRLVGMFSPIHIFSLFTYLSLFNGLRAVIVKRDIRRHRIEMQSLYVGALMLAGAFTLLPGRRMHAVLFGADAGIAPSIIAIGMILVLAGALGWRWRRAAYGSPMVER